MIVFQSSHEYVKQVGSIQFIYFISHKAIQMYYCIMLSLSLLNLFIQNLILIFYSICMIIVFLIMRVEIYKELAICSTYMLHLYLIQVL